MLMEGILTNKNNVELARKYFEKAARCGNTDAQKNLEKYFGEYGEQKWQMSIWQSRV